MNLGGLRIRNVSMVSCSDRTGVGRRLSGTLVFDLSGASDTFISLVAIRIVQVTILQYYQLLDWIK